MNWIRLHPRSAALIGLTLLLPLYFYLKTLIGLLGLGLDYSAERSRIEPRVARMQGMLEREELLAQQSELAVRELRRFVYSSAEAPSTLAAGVQADLRQILNEAGLSVSNSQVLPLREGEDFDRVAVKVTAGGTLASLDAALAGLAAHEPVLIVESLDTFPVRAARGDTGTERQRLTAVMQIMVLRQLP